MWFDQCIVVSCFGAGRRWVEGGLGRSSMRVWREAHLHEGARADAVLEGQVEVAELVRGQVHVLLERRERRAAALLEGEDRVACLDEVSHFGEVGGGVGGS